MSHVKLFMLLAIVPQKTFVRVSYSSVKKWIENFSLYFIFSLTSIRSALSAYAEQQSAFSVRRLRDFVRIALQICSRNFTAGFCWLDLEGLYLDIFFGKIFSFFGLWRLKVVLVLIKLSDKLKKKEKKEKEWLRIWWRVKI